MSHYLISYTTNYVVKANSREEAYNTFNKHYVEPEIAVDHEHMKISECQRTPCDFDPELFDDGPVFFECFNLEPNNTVQTAAML